LQNMKNYVKKYWNLIIDNVRYGQQITKTVKQNTGIDLYR